jgi:TRAP-type C4-dicarboxylate transport system permease small subunit
MSRRFVRAVEALSRAGGIASALLLLTAMIVVCQMILLRYVFRAATIWQTEAVVFTATAAIFIGAPYVLLKGGHVGVDVIENIVSPRSGLRLKRIGAVLGLLFCLIMTVATGIHFLEAWQGDWTTPSVAAVPLWMPLAPMLAGFALLCLQYVAEIIKLFGDAR